MASRYPTVKVVDYCFNPRHVVDDDKDIIVPCGKCDGCLLHKANEWSMRCGMEIEGSPATIFGSLTYNNKYLPKLVPAEYMYLSPLCTDNEPSSMKDFPLDLALCYGRTWYSQHSLNVRFNGVRDVLREDDIVVRYSYSSIDISHWDNINNPSIAYASKRDIQLWLKLLRRFLDERISYKDPRILAHGYFRYFIISEIGPTTLRPHFHFLLFCQSNEVAQALLDGALYENWKMCNEDRFVPYCHLCDSGARGYVTQYLTCFSSLPRVYQEVKELRPFRLASKAPAVGYIEQDKAKIYEDVSRGVINYTREVHRLESTSLLEYPKNYLLSLFPKCYRFSKMDDSRRYSVYRYLYGEVRECGESYYLLLKRLPKVMHAQDFLATCACYRFCRDFVNSPQYYYYLLDTYYYKLEMSHLKSFYEAQSEIDFFKYPERIFEFYPNIECLCNDGFVHSSFLSLTLLGYHVYDLIGNKEFFLDVRQKIKKNNQPYYNEVADIHENMIKVSKFNEMTQNAPTIV